MAAVSVCRKSELAIRTLVTQYKTNGDLQHETVSLVASNPWSGMVIWKAALKRSMELEVLVALPMKVLVFVPQSVTEAWLYGLRSGGVN